MPRVSVVMTVYNGERFVRDAIQSLLAQTYRDIEVIVVDDASTDRSVEVISRFRDPRLVLVESDLNRGPFAAANHGLSLVRGEFVARMDCDDLALPRRFERQLAILESRPELGISGSSCHIIDAEGRRTAFAPVPYHDLGIRWQSLLRTPFHHSTVMMRRQVLEHHELRYDEGLRIAGDYELWPRILAHAKGANEKAAVVNYRVWKGGITGSSRPEQQAIQDSISMRTIEAVLPGIEVSPEDLRALRELVVVDRHHGGAAPKGEGSRVFHAPLSRRRALAEVYLGMFRAFVKRHRRDPYLKALTVQVEKRASLLAAGREG